MAAIGLVQGLSAETWRGLTVAPEHRCSAYNKKRDYPYPQSVERDIVRELGAVYAPLLAGRCFASTRETDIEPHRGCERDPRIPACARRSRRRRPDSRVICGT